MEWIRAGYPHESTPSADLDALPEGDPAGDLLRGVLGLGVVPGGVAVDLAVDLDGEVGRRALPGADAVVVRRAQDVVAHRLAREVRVAFHDDDVVGLREDGAVPGCSGHVPLNSGRRSAHSGYQRSGYISLDCAVRHARQCPQLTMFSGV